MPRVRKPWLGWHLRHAARWGGGMCGYWPKAVLIGSYHPGWHKHFRLDVQLDCRRLSVLHITAA